jgi:hypothetical protein
MQVGEQRLALAQKRDLLRLGLLDPEHHLGRVEDVVGGRKDARALGLEVGIGDRAALAGPALNEHLVAVLGELADADGRQRDAVLVGLHLAGDATFIPAPPPES